VKFEVCSALVTYFIELNPNYIHLTINYTLVTVVKSLLLYLRLVLTSPKCYVDNGIGDGITGPLRAQHPVGLRI
jgi:hypothetical protein